jgi:hypothetical protein
VWRKRPAGCLLRKASQFAAEGRDPTAFVIAPRSVSRLGRTGLLSTLADAPNPLAPTGQARQDQHARPASTSWRR